MLPEGLLTPARKRALLASMAGAILLYGVGVAYAGWPEMKAALAGIGPSAVLAALGLSLVNYALRFTRWQFYLARLGHRVPVGASATYYVAGFALTTTPGKAGEMVRGLFLKRHGVPFPTTLAAFLAERVSDLAAVLALCAAGLLAGRYALAGEIAIALTGLGLAFLAFPPLLAPFRRLAPTTGRLGALVTRAFALLDQLHACFSPVPLLAGFALSLLAWAAEGYALHLLLDAAGSPITLGQAQFAYAASLLVGALTMLPGGLGGTEVTLAGLLGAAGVPAATAGAVTIAIRLFTLWFAVALGAAALALAGRTRPQPAAAV